MGKWRDGKQALGPQLRENPNVETVLSTVCRAKRGLLETSPADEMHYFQLVAIFELSVGPACAWHDFQIQLDGDTIAFHAELLDERSKRQAIRKVARFTVDS